MRDREKPDNTRRDDLLGWLGLTDEPDFRRARPLGLLIGVLLILLYVCAVIAAFVTLAGVIRGTAGEATGGGLGAGALVVALLSAPFLIWATIIKHRALGFQKEGHLTDRISKAVEHLGAEKTISYLARNVTRQARPPEQQEAGESDWVDHLQKLDRNSLSHARITDDAADYTDWKVFSETVPNIEVRIGGILSLERIAQDSTAYDRGRDRVRAMEILCAYVRENAPASGAKDHGFGEWEPLEDNATEAERVAHLERRAKRFGDAMYGTGLVRQWAEKLPPPRADIAIALDVIGRRDADQRRVESGWGKDAEAGAEWVFDILAPQAPETEGEAVRPPTQIDSDLAALRTWQAKIAAYRGYRLDLRKTNLESADLSSHVLSGARLNEARLEGARLCWEARLEGADLGQARIEGADLKEARMQGADLWQARMEGANLGQARMEDAELTGVRMEGADLGGARMERAILREARMEGADLRWARMQGAELSGVRMEGADFGGASMEGANLSKSRMDVTTTLDGARLSGAAVRDLDLSSVRLSPDQVASIFGDASVILPPDIARPAHWPTGQLDTSDFDTEYRKWQPSPATFAPPPPPSPDPAP